jgi:hypothetical protein
MPEPIERFVVVQDELTRTGSIDRLIDDVPSRRATESPGLGVLPGDGPWCMDQGPIAGRMPLTTFLAYWMAVRHAG